MNEDKINELAEKVAEFVLTRVVGTDLTACEVSEALGQAIALVTFQPLAKRLKEELLREPVPDEEEKAEEEGEEFRFLSVQERLFAFNELAPKYGDEDARLIMSGKLDLPEWLQKVIVERRG